MNRFAAFPIMIAAALAPMQGQARPSDGYYVAVPATPAEKAKLVTRSTIWKCDASGCTAARSTSRDTIMCELLVREVGPLSAFRAGETTFDADALARCNGKAR
ncbi:CC_3452 family protein [Sphingomonas sp. RS6]